MARAMKDSGVPWIGKMPADWNFYRMKSCIADRTAGSWGNEVAEDEGNIVCLRIADFDYAKFRFKDTPINELTMRNYDDKTIASLLLHKGDILIEKSGGGEKTPVGRTVIFDKEYRALYANFMDRLRCTNLVTSDWMQYVFVTFYKNEYIRNYIKQTTGIQNLDLTSMLANERIPVPTLPEQKRIVALLDAECSRVDAVIEKTRASIEEYKKLKQSVITEAVTKGIRPSGKMKDSGVEWIGEIPEEWNCLKIKWLLDERNERSEHGLEEPLSMSQKYGLIPTKEMDMVPNMASSFVGAKVCYPGDLVFNKLKAHLGVFALSKFHGLVSPDYAVYHSRGIANLKYLEYLFKTPQYIAEFKKKSTGVGAGLTRLYSAGLYSIYSTIPPLSEQSEIVEYLDEKTEEISALIRQKEGIITELESYKKSLIFEYVTGKKEAF